MALGRSASRWSRSTPDRHLLTSARNSPSRTGAASSPRTTECGGEGVR
jgi:hypothetical protein